MATTTTAPASGGALASVSGWFGDFVKSVTPVAQSYIQYKTATQNAGNVAATQANDAAQVANQALANAAAKEQNSVTSKPWFPWAIGGGALVLLAIVFLALRKK